MRKVKLTYFKESGKYYCNGEYKSEFSEDFWIYDEVRQHALHADKSNPLPGLVSNWDDGYILVEPENGVPAIIRTYG